MTTKIIAYVDETFPIELDEEGQRLWEAYENGGENPDPEPFASYLASRITLKGKDVGVWWEDHV